MANPQVPTLLTPENAAVILIDHQPQMGSGSSRSTSRR